MFRFVLFFRFVGCSTKTTYYHSTFYCSLIKQCVSNPYCSEVLGHSPWLYTANIIFDIILCINMRSHQLSDFLIRSVKVQSESWRNQVCSWASWAPAQDKLIIWRRFKTLLSTHTLWSCQEYFQNERERRLLGCASSDLRVASAFKQAAEDQSASGKGTVSVASVSPSTSYIHQRYCCDLLF